MIDNNKLSELVGQGGLGLRLELQGLHPNVDIIGRLSGNYCSVYFFYDINEKPQKVLRVWQKNPIDPMQIKHIYDYLGQQKLEYFVKCSHYDNALSINDKKLSADVMDCVEGKSLVDYVDDCMKSGQEGEAKMRQLANDFKQMCIELKNAQIAHGDLSGDNIMVTPQGRLRLIDYDSMCIPELIGKNGRIAGNGAFNHPNRTQQPMSLSRDHFAEIVIYLTLVALCEKPELWDRYMPTLGPGETHDPPMIIKEANLKSYEQFTVSKVYKDLSQIRNQEVQNFLEKLSKALLSDGTNVSFPFGDIPTTGTGTGTGTTTTTGTGTGTTTTTGTGTGTTTTTGTEKGKDPPQPPKPWWKNPFVWIAIAAISFFGGKEISAYLANSQQSEQAREIIVPALESQAWRVTMLNGEQMRLGDTGATITAQNANGTAYKIEIYCTSMAIKFETSITVDRYTGIVSSPELGEGRVEVKEDNFGKQLKLIFNGCIIEK